MKQANVDRRGYSVEEVAHMWGVSRAHVFNLISDGTLHSFKAGARRIVPQSAIDAMERGDEGGRAA